MISRPVASVEATGGSVTGPSLLGGPRRIGLRPGRPFVHLVGVSGPVDGLDVAGLPPGLAFEPSRRVIAGRTTAIGRHEVRITGEAAAGRLAESIELVVGDTICLTPPVGWNSWHAFGPAVTEDDVRRAASVLVESGLAARGWTTVNIDDGWQGTRDRGGRLRPNERFRDLRSLCDDLHGLGLRAGIYSSPGPLTCGGFPGSAGHEAEDAASLAAWGFDHLKYDWCSAGGHTDDQPLETWTVPYLAMREALDGVDRDIVYHVCQYGLGEVWRWARARVGANAWRTTGDIVDTWDSVAGIGFGQADLAEFAGPGGWNDPDMLVVGWVGGAWGRPLEPTRLTPDEERTHLGLWVLLAAPLLVGCDLARLPGPTLELLSNPELLAIQSDVLGRQARRISVAESLEVWRRPLADGASAIGVFNRGDCPTTAGIEWRAFGHRAESAARDVWAQRDLEASGGWHGRLPAHGSVLLRVGP